MLSSSDYFFLFFFIPLLPQEPNAQHLPLFFVLHPGAIISTFDVNVPNPLLFFYVRAHCIRERDRPSNDNVFFHVVFFVLY